MAQLTLSAILSQGMVLGGRTDLTTLATVDLLAWLRERAFEWPWPQLRKKVGNDISSLALNSGATSLLFGNGNGGEALEVQEIYDPIYLYTSDYSTKQTVRIRSALAGDIFMDETANNPLVSKGTPQLMKIKSKYGTSGAFTLYPYPVPDKNYVLSFDYIVVPADAALTDKPWYPSDMTMIQRVKVFVMDYNRKYDVLEQERSLLSQMISADKVRHGSYAGSNDSLPLDTGVFRSSGVTPWWSK